jgi:hypothetical protein
VLFNGDINYYVHIQVVLVADEGMSMEHYWNDSDKGKKPRYSPEAPVRQCHFNN